MSLRLTVRSPTGGSFSTTFDDPQVRVGRASFCELRLPYPVVSSHHLTIHGSDGEWHLVDEGSTNGTWLDGRRITPGEQILVRDELRLEIVDVEIEFQLVRHYVDGFTLAESGTMLRQMVSEAAAVPDDDLAFLEILDGPSAGTRLPIPDDAADLLVGSHAEATLRAEHIPPRVANVRRAGEGFRIVAAVELAVDEEPVPPEGVMLRSGCHLALGDGTRMVFFDPLEAYLEELDEPAAQSAAAPADDAGEEPATDGAPPESATGLSWSERLLLLFGIIVMAAAAAALLIIFDLVELV